MTTINWLLNRPIVSVLLLVLIFIRNVPFATAASMPPPPARASFLKGALTSAAFYGQLSKIVSLLRQRPSQHAKNVALRDAITGAHGDSQTIDTYIAIIRQLIPRRVPARAQIPMMYTGSHGTH